MEDLRGRRFEVTVGPVAHGGHCVGRIDGRVVFVRHAVPGERVVVEVTEGRADARFLRGDAVEVLAASPDRVAPPCPFAVPGGCGGCDFQHVALPAQRRLKADVVREQLRRLAGIDVDVEVEAVPGDSGGLGWRTRVGYAVVGGRAGLRAHRSHRVVHVDRCRIAHPGLPDVPGRAWTGVRHVEALVSGTGEQLVLADSAKRMRREGPRVLHERAAGRIWQVTGSGFWQVHPGAASTLVAAVLAAGEPKTGDRVVELYSGVGLFTGPLAERVGPTGRVVGVESDRTAVEDASANLADLPQVELVEDRVDRALRRGTVGTSAALVVLDPPRSGAKRAVVAAVAALGPRRVVYVACDPAALARDVATFARLGYGLTRLRAFDAFPMTHHVECVAALEKLP